MTYGSGFAWFMWYAVCISLYIKNNIKLFNKEKTL